MAKKCSIQVNGQEHIMLTQLADYIDNSEPNSRSVEKVVDILKEGRGITSVQGVPGLFVTEDQRKDIKLINSQGMVPGLIDVRYFESIAQGPDGSPTNLYKIEVNDNILQQRPKVGDSNSNFNYNNQYELDQFNRLSADKKSTQTTEKEIPDKPESPKVYSTNAQAQNELQQLALDAKIIIEAQLQEVKSLPDEMREKKEIRLKRLQAAVDKIKRADDFFMFVVANRDNINNAVEEFNSIMALPIEERAKPENMNRMYEIKNTLDSVDTLAKLKQVVIDQIALGQQGRLQEILDNIKNTIDRAEELDNSFEREIIPIMAEVLVGYHNQAIDPKIDSIIKNIEKFGDWRRFKSEIDRTNEYKELEKRLKDGKITTQGFEDAAKRMTLDSFKNRKILGRDKLIKEMTAAHKDKSAFSYYFDPLIYSSEAAIQLFTKSVKEATFKKNEMTLDFKYILKEEYDAFTEGMNETQIAKLNDDLLEVVTYYRRDANGDISSMELLSLVHPLLINKFNEDRIKMRERLNKKYNRPQREDYTSKAEYGEANAAWDRSKNKTLYYRAEQKWIQENTEPIEGWEKQIAKLNREIGEAEKTLQKAKAAGRSDAEYNAMQQIKETRKAIRSMINPVTGKPKGPLVKPKASVYTNPKYTAIQNDPRKKRYYDFTLKSLRETQQMIGKKRMRSQVYDEYSYLMPSIRKNNFDRAMEQGLVASTKELLSDTFTVQETEKDVFGNYNEQTGELQQTVPVFYTNEVDHKDISKDIASSLYQFRDMANNYVTKNEIVGQVMLFRNILKNRDTMEVDAEGVAYLSGIANKLGVKLPAKKAGESYTFKHVDAFIDTIMFGQRELKENFSLMGLKTISANKFANALNSFVAMNTLSFNFLQGANQSIIDNMALISEANAGEFFSRSDLAWAKSQYWSEGAGLSDTGRFIPDTKLGKALEMFDGLTEFTDQEGRRLVGGKLRKALELGNLLVVQQAAEHEVATTRMLALMKNLEGKLKDKDGNVINNEDGKPANLYDLLTIDKKTGKMSVDPRVANFNKSDFINLVQGLARRTNQTKGGFDRPTAQRMWYGKLAMLFRSWLVPGLRRRYGHGGFTGPTVHADEELGTVTQGMYISFWNFLRKSIADRAWPHTVFDQLTEMEQRNIKRAGTEFGSLAAAFVLIQALQNLDDDEENFATNFLLYQTLRYQAEIVQWTPGVGAMEAIRILKSPTATARQVEQTIKLISQIKNEGLYNLGFPVDEKDIFYQRDSGRYQKGDRKIRKSLEDLLPILRGLNKTKTPEEAAKYFLGGTYN